MENKYYGVFSVTAQGKRFKEVLLRQIYYRFILGAVDYDKKAMNPNSLGKTARDEHLKDFAASWRAAKAYDRKYQRCHSFSTKYFIHQCDKNGILIPSKKELEEAKLMFSESN